ncbi:hypothetical protein DXG01_003274 [Tephrocybe rancida]|nr:hypothetical protein DXG01_003274 [Tephrocybe rancida]
MKFTTFATTTSLLAFALSAHAQVADPAAAATSLVTDAAATGTTSAIAADATGVTDPAIGTDPTDVGAPSVTSSLPVSGLISKASGVATSTPLAGAPGAPGVVGTAGAPGAGVVPAASPIRPTAIQPTSGTGSLVRPSFFPSLTGGPATTANAAAKYNGVAAQGTVYAVLGAVIAAMF